MTKPTELTANDFVSASLDRLEPHRNERTGNRVRGDAHVRQEKIVNHILRGKFDDDWAIDWHMQFAAGHDVVFAGGIVWVEPERIGVCDQTNLATAKLAVGSRQMKIKIELLGHHVDNNSVSSWWKFVHAFRPQRNGEAQEQHGFDQNNGELEVRGDTAANTGMIGFRMATSAKADQNKKKKGRPSEKQRAHKPVRELQNVIDLIAVLRRVGRLAEKFVNERKATHTCSNLLRPTPDVVRAAFGHVAKS